MSGYHPLLKKPKIEKDEEKQLEEEPEEEDSNPNMEQQIINEQEEALVALIEHRTKEVEHLRQRITYYNSQLNEAQKSLGDSQNKLANLQRQKIENQTRSKPQVVHSIVQQNVTDPTKTKEPGNRISNGSGSLSTSSTPKDTNILAKVKQEKVHKVSSEKDDQPKGTGRKLVTEQREHKDLIQSINKSSSPVTIRCQTGCFLSSQHKRKLRSLVLCPTNDQLFVTSALDGIVNLWQLQGRGSSATLLSSTDCQSDKQRRWPEDIAWHPHGDKLFSVYSAEGGDSQISILNLNKGKEKTRVSFLQDKPHTKGIISSVMFMPWDNNAFVTGGSDHAVFLWSEKDSDGSWKPKVLHRHYHSSAVMGVAGMQHRNIVMSAGADKRIFGFDVQTERLDYRHQIDSKCMSILPNPRDFNLFAVQTGTPGQQLRLFDLRLRQMEIHACGWKQESSDSQSALINQAWSPDGVYMSSGSADPVIHIFDIRYNGCKPCQSIRAHQKRVFKAAWHHALPLLISISSDLNIGLHKINM